MGPIIRTPTEKDVMLNTTIRISKDLWNRLVNAADKEHEKWKKAGHGNLSRSDFIRECLEYALREYDRQEQELEQAEEAAKAELKSKRQTKP